MAGGLQPGRGCREPRGRPRGRVRQAVLTGASAHRCQVWPMRQRPVQRRHGCAPTPDKGPDQRVPPGVGDVPMRTYSGGPGGRGLSQPAAGRGPVPGERAAWPRRPGLACAHGGGAWAQETSLPGQGQASSDRAGGTSTDRWLFVKLGPAPLRPRKQSPSVRTGLPPGPLGTTPRDRAEPPPGLSSHMSQAQAGPGGVCRGTQGALPNTHPALQALPICPAPGQPRASPASPA